MNTPTVTPAIKAATNHHAEIILSPLSVLLFDQIGSLYKATSFSVSVSANSDGTIEINSAETGYRYGVLVGIYASVSWGACSIITVMAQNTLYPNRIKVHSTQAQTVSATILWFK